MTVSAPAQSFPLLSRYLPVVFLAAVFLLTVGPLLLPTRAFLLIGLGLVVVAAVHAPQSLVFGSRDAFFLIFFASLTGAAFFTGASLDEFLEITRWVGLGVIAKLAVALFSRNQVAAAIVAQGLMVSAITLATNIARDQFSWVFRFQLESEFIHKNDAGAVIGIALLALFAIRPVWWTTISLRALGSSLILVLSVIVIYLQSLAAFGAVIIGIASLLLWSMLRSAPITIRKLGLGLIWSLPVLVVTLAQALGVFVALGKRNDFFGRLDIWAFTLPDWSEHWLFGHPGGYWTTERTEAFAANAGFSVSASDNSFLDVFLNHGLISLVAFIALIGWALFGGARALLHDPEAKIWSTVSILFICTISFFNSTLLSPMFFTLLAILIYRSPPDNRPGAPATPSKAFPMHRSKRA